MALKDEYCPEMHDNIYIQHMGGMIGQYGGNEKSEPDILIFDENAEEKIETVFGDKNAKLYIIGQGRNYQESKGNEYEKIRKV